VVAGVVLATVVDGVVLGVVVAGVVLDAVVDGGVVDVVVLDVVVAGAVSTGVFASVLAALFNVVSGEVLTFVLPAIVLCSCFNFCTFTRLSFASVCFSF